MNTRDFEANLAAAQGYYHAMLAKDFEKMEGYLHEDVLLISPLAELQGKEAVVTAARNFSEILKHIEFRARFEGLHQVMLAYDFTFFEPIGKLRAAALIEFKGPLLSRIELFYDARPFVTKKDEIFEP